MHRLIPEAINPIFIDKFPESISEEIGGDRRNRRSRGGEENKRRGRSSGRIVGATRGVGMKGENEKIKP